MSASTTPIPLKGSGMTRRHLENYSSNADDDAIIAEELLKTFYGRRDHSVEQVSDDELLQLAAIHASLSQAQSLREMHERLQ